MRMRTLSAYLGASRFREDDSQPNALGGLSAPEDVKVGLPLFFLLQWQMFVKQYDPGGRVKPREIAEAFFQRVPVVAKVSRELQGMSQSAKQVPLTPIPAREPNHKAV